VLDFAAAPGEPLIWNPLAAFRTHPDLKSSFVVGPLVLLRRSRKSLAIAVPAILILGVGILLARKIGESYGWDDGAYLASARAMIQGHPLFTSVFSSQPPVFLELLAAAFRVFGDSGETGAWMALVFALACLAIVGWMAHQVAGPMASPFAVLAMLSKIFLGQALGIEAEIPALALALLAVAMLVPGDATWRVAAAGGVFSIAVLCKLWVLPYGVPLIVLTVLPPDRDEAGAWRMSWSPRRAIRRLTVVGLSGGLVSTLVLGGYDLHAAYDQVVGMHVRARQLGTETWGRTGTDLLVRFARDEVLICALALVGAGFLLKRNPRAGSCLLLWLLACAAFLVGHLPVFIRHVLLVSPPLALLAASAVSGMFSRWSRPLYRYTAASVVAVLMVVRPTATGEAGIPLWRILATPVRADRAQVESIRLMTRFSTPGDIVVTDDPLQAFLARRALPPRLVDISGTRVLSGTLTTLEAISLSQDAKVIVFWARNLERLPGYRAWVQSRYRKVKTWRDSDALREMWIR
jgi:hypothetical protein